MILLPKGFTRGRLLTDGSPWDSEGVSCTHHSGAPAPPRGAPLHSGPGHCLDRQQLLRPQPAFSERDVASGHLPPSPSLPTDREPEFWAGPPSSQNPEIDSCSSSPKRPMSRCPAAREPASCSVVIGKFKGRVSKKRESSGGRGNAGSAVPPSTLTTALLKSGLSPRLFHR